MIKLLLTLSGQVPSGNSKSCTVIPASLNSFSSYKESFSLIMCFIPYLINYYNTFVGLTFYSPIFLPIGELNAIICPGIIQFMSPSLTEQRFSQLLRSNEAGLYHLRLNPAASPLKQSSTLTSKPLYVKFSSPASIYGTNIWSYPFSLNGQKACSGVIPLTIT